MKKLLAPYRQELLDRAEKELRDLLRSNYKDYMALVAAASESKEQAIVELEQPVYMSVQGIESGKPRWQAYSN